MASTDGFHTTVLLSLSYNLYSLSHLYYVYTCLSVYLLVLYLEVMTVYMHVCMYVSICGYASLLSMYAFVY